MCYNTVRSLLGRFFCSSHDLDGETQNYVPVMDGEEMSGTRCIIPESKLYACLDFPSHVFALNVSGEIDPLS